MKHDQLNFVWTVASGSSRKALRLAQKETTVECEYRDESIDLSEYSAPEIAMLSFATKNNTPWAGPEWFIDSGGYSTLSADGSYEQSPEDYIQFIAEHEQRKGVEIGKFALRDWACEPDLLRENDRSERLHQNWTIRDHCECLRYADEYGIDAEPVAVLQGYDLRDYQHHLDYYRDHGLLTDTVGIGSVCKRTNIEEIRSIVSTLRDELPSRVSIHGFGVERELIEHQDVVNALDSVDTAAWDSKAYYNAVSNNSEGQNRYTWDNVLEAYGEYRKEVATILDDHQDVDDDDRSRTVVPLSQFGSMEVGAGSTHPLIQCVCGQLIDPEKPDTHDVGCRHCERARMNINMAHDGLLCDPEHDDHHPLCPHDVSQEAAPEPNVVAGDQTQPEMA